MAEADQALLALAQKLKLTEAGKPLLPTASSMRIGNNSCLRANLETGEIKAYGSGECTNSAQETWLVDGLDGHRRAPTDGFTARL